MIAGLPVDAPAFARVTLPFPYFVGRQDLRHLRLTVINPRRNPDAAGVQLGLVPVDDSLVTGQALEMDGQTIFRIRTVHLIENQWLIPVAMGARNVIVPPVPCVEIFRNGAFIHRSGRRSLPFLRKVAVHFLTSACLVAR